MPADARLPAGTSVLLVEDETLIAIDAQDILHGMGAHRLVRVRNVQEGIDALDAERFDVALLDLRLGKESSLPLALRLVSLVVPFGLRTGFAGDAIPPELKDRPYLAKPFTPEQLSSFVLRVVRRC